MNKPWSYSTNFVYAACKDSFANAVRISTHHLSALNASKSDPAILAMYNAYLPLHNALMTAYTKWLAQSDLQQGITDALTQLLKSLTAKVNAWDAAIQIAYPKGSSNYKGMFPKGHKPFQTGTQDERVSTVNSLLTKLTPITALATTKTDVNNTYTALNNALTTKNDALKTTNNLSDAVMAALVTMTTQQFVNYANLLIKFISNLSKVDTFFDLENIRKSQQKIFKRKLVPNKLRMVVKRTFKPNDTILIKNTGSTEIEFYIVPTKTSDPGASTYIAGPNTVNVIPATVLGNLENSTFLMVRNLSDSVKGSYEVELP